MEYYIAILLILVILACIGAIPTTRERTYRILEFKEHGYRLHLSPYRFYTEITDKEKYDLWVSGKAEEVKI